MKFEWDPEKDRANQKKHGIAFFTAKKVFSDANRKDLPDHRHSSEEPRRITIGKAGKILFVVYTERYYDIGEVIRIISARRATEQERSFYYDRNGLFGHEQTGRIQ